MTETRTALLDELSDELLAAHRAERVIVAVDGVDGAGKTRFADAWAAALVARGVAVVRVGIDGFHRPRAERFARGRDSAEGYYRDSFDHGALREQTVVPFRSGATEVVTAVFAAARLRERDGAASLAARYSDGQAIYWREAQPHRAATIVIDNADYEHPRRVFADFC